MFKNVYYNDTNNSNFNFNDANVTNVEFIPIFTVGRKLAMAFRCSNLLVLHRNKISMIYIQSALINLDFSNLEYPHSSMIFLKLILFLYILPDLSGYLHSDYGHLYLKQFISFAIENCLLI